MLNSLALVVVCLCVFNLIIKLATLLADKLAGERPEELPEFTQKVINFNERTWIGSAIIVALWFLI
jgi:hypothetical protein